MPTVFLNGEFLSRDDARVSAFDAGFQHGVGLFETMLARTDPPHIFHLHEHLARLAESARSLRLTETLRTHALAEACERTLDHAAEEIEAPRLRLRLTLTGGDLNLLDRGAGASAQPTILIVAQPATPYPPAMMDKGVQVIVADLKLNPLDPLSGHKTLSYWSRLRELQRAGAARAAEALVLQISNHLAGGCVSNVFLVRHGRLQTPIARGEELEIAGDAAKGPAVMPSPVLPGITRRWVMDWATAMDIAVERRMLSINDVLEADEMFLTNSSWGVLPVVQLETHQISGGAPGSVGRAAVNAWRELIGDEGSL